MKDETNLQFDTAEKIKQNFLYSYVEYCKKRAMLTLKNNNEIEPRIVINSMISEILKYPNITKDTKLLRKTLENRKNIAASTRDKALELLSNF